MARDARAGPLQRVLGGPEAGFDRFGFEMSTGSWLLPFAITCAFLVSGASASRMGRFALRRDLIAALDSRLSASHWPLPRGCPRDQLARFEPRWSSAAASASPHAPLRADRLIAFFLWSRLAPVWWRCTPNDPVSHWPVARDCLYTWSARFGFNRRS